MRLRRALRHVERALAVVGALAIVFGLFFELSIVVSPSMSPTLEGTSRHDGDWLLAERITYRLREPRRWEVITFFAEDHLPVAKRIAGLPGETLSIDDEWLVVDGEARARPPSLSFLRYYAFGHLAEGRQARFDDGYFVLGDDSKDSHDSRFTGAVAPEDIIGRAMLIVWPLDRIGWVHR